MGCPFLVAMFEFDPIPSQTGHAPLKGYQNGVSVSDIHRWLILSNGFAWLHPYEWLGHKIPQ